MSRILIVDDEPGIRTALAAFFRQEGYATSMAADGHEALAAVKNGNLDLVISDLRMPGMDGIALMREIRQWSPETLVVLMTAFASVETAVEALREGAADYFTKPVELDEAGVRVRSLLERRDLLRENRYLREVIDRSFNFNFIIGESEPMKQLYRMIEKIAPSRSTVLVTGPSGSGKELIARAIHQRSDRAAKPFIAVNCGSIPESLFESELFGHKKGSFTGATQDREGVFSLADKGTLFLDEIGELPLAMQVKLLRVLQDGEVKPVGATAGHEVDVRILAATNRDLEQEVAEGRFREDLFYRLNIIRIRMPGLRERWTDIPLLAGHFVEKFNREFRKSVKGIGAEAMQVMVAHEWKGQVRELENAMERAVLLCDGDFIQPSDLPMGSAGATAIDQLPGADSGLSDAVSMFERQYIRHMLERYQGNRGETARALGVDPSTLYRKMEKHHLLDS